jgi:hypothetical protein
MLGSLFDTSWLFMFIYILDDVWYSLIKVFQWSTQFGSRVTRLLLDMLARFVAFWGLLRWPVWVFFRPQAASGAVACHCQLMDATQPRSVLVDKGHLRRQAKDHQSDLGFLLRYGWNYVTLVALLMAHDYSIQQTHLEVCSVIIFVKFQVVSQ